MNVGRLAVFLGPNALCALYTHCQNLRDLLLTRVVEAVRDAGYSVTTRVPIIEVQDQQLRADICLINIFD